MDSNTAESSSDGSMQSMEQDVQIVCIEEDLNRDPRKMIQRSDQLYTHTKRRLNTFSVSMNHFIVPKPESTVNENTHIKTKITILFSYHVDFKEVHGGPGNVRSDLKYQNQSREANSVPGKSFQRCQKGWKMKTDPPTTTKRGTNPSMAPDKHIRPPSPPPRGGWPRAVAR